MTRFDGQHETSGQRHCMELQLVKREAQNARHHDSFGEGRFALPQQPRNRRLTIINATMFGGPGF